jgi:hypothetical protein
VLRSDPGRRGPRGLHRSPSRPCRSKRRRSSPSTSGCERPAAGVAARPPLRMNFAKSHGRWGGGSDRVTASVPGVARRRATVRSSGRGSEPSRCPIRETISTARGITDSRRPIRESDANSLLFRKRGRRIPPTQKSSICVRLQARPQKGSPFQPWDPEDPSPPRPPRLPPPCGSGSENRGSSVVPLTRRTPPRPAGPGRDRPRRRRRRRRGLPSRPIPTPEAAPRDRPR